MLEPLKQWYCDNCGEVIEKSKDGYVIWRRDDNNFDCDFRIIHQGKCDNKREYSLSMSLDNFLGINGLQYLLQYLSIGIIKKNLGQENRPWVG